MPAVAIMYTGVSLCFSSGTCSAAKVNSGSMYSLAADGLFAYAEMPERMNPWYVWLLPSNQINHS